MSCQFGQRKGRARLSTIGTKHCRNETLLVKQGGEFMQHPVVRLHNENGVLVLRDGVVASFFLRASHQEIGKQAAAVFSRYVNFIGTDRLTWFAGETQWEQLGAAEFAQLHQEMAACQPEWSVLIDAVDSSLEVPGFRFRYRGKWLADPVFSPWESAVSSITLWFPTEFFNQLGAVAFREGISSIVHDLPFDSGYVSPAFCYLEGDAELVAFREIRRLAFRYPGIDVYDLLQTGFLIGQQLKGAYWLNFLGPAVVANNVEKIEALTALLSSDPNASVETIAADSLIVTLGSEPNLADADSQANVDAYRTFTRVMQECIASNIGQFTCFDEQDMDTWRRRFISSDAAGMT